VTSKISNGWYRTGTMHIVRTDAYGDDAATDWIVTGCENYARKVHTSMVHGNRRFRVSLCDVDSIHNTKRDALRWTKERT